MAALINCATHRKYCEVLKYGTQMKQNDLATTDYLRKLYRRTSLFYDALDWPFEHFLYKRLRRELWKDLSGRILDLGAGTGRNAFYYPKDADVVTADLSPEMLERARRRIEALGRKPHIVVADALYLYFKD